MLGFRRPTCPQVSEQCPIASRVAGNRDGWSPRASQQDDRAASAASDARKGWKLKLVPPGPNDRRGQVESLGRNRLTPDAPYKGLLRDKTRLPGEAPLPPEAVAQVLSLTCSEPPGEVTL